MKKILYSLLVAGGVGGLAFGATQAWFSDRETSVGNTFVAGKVDLTIDSTAHYDGLVCTDRLWVLDGSLAENALPRHELLGQQCEGTWPAGNLTNEKFWNLSDVKPGDYGENTISMHVENNPVWACIDVSNMQNNENGCNNPETKVPDLTCGDPGAGLGELAQNIRFTAWSDANCDNVWAGNPTEPLLFTNQQGPASDVLNGRTYALADSTHGPGPLPASTEQHPNTCIGLQWCAGTMTINPIDHTITCDGSTMGNDTQTDSLTADVAFRVEQSRNNPNFICSTPHD